MPEPRVSGVITVRDGERHLAAAIESMLSQTHRLAEVIVIDNGSTDRSREVAAGYEDEVRIVDEPRPGIGAARNAGLAAARGDYLGFLDHDDLWEPRKTELQLAAFADDPDLDLVFGHVEQFFDPDLDPALAARLKVVAGPQPGLFIGALLASVDVWNRVGPWERELGASDVLDWLIRARRQRLRERMLPDLVARRRIHGANRSFSNHSDRREWAVMLKAAIDERRRDGDRSSP